jgi:hypothetical protein
MRFLAQFAVCSFIAWLVWLFVDRVFQVFGDITFFSVAALLMLFIAVAIRKKTEQGPTLLLLRLPFIVFALVFLVIVAVKLPMLFPLSTRLPGRTFHNASLAEVLQYISEQRHERPYWRFQVYDEQAVNIPFGMTIPDGCTLREALDSVSRRINCTCDWYWSRGGDSYSRPIHATFLLRRKGSKLDYTSDYFLFVQGSHVWRPPPKAQPAPSPNEERAKR